MQGQSLLFVELLENCPDSALLTEQHARRPAVIHTNLSAALLQARMSPRVAPNIGRTRKKKTASELLPRVHRVVSLLKRWLIGTHQGAVSHKYLDYYLDEFTVRFNRRSSRSRGKLFFRLAEQAVAVDPVPYERIVRASSDKFKGKAQSVVAT